MRVLLIFTTILTISAAFEFPRIILDAYDTVTSWFMPDKLLDKSKLKYISNITNFEEFKKKASRNYKDSDEEAKRQRIFYENLEYIKKHNDHFDRGDVSYALDTNFFFDYKPSELLSAFTGIRKTGKGDTKADLFITPGAPNFGNAKIPSSVDLVHEGAVQMTKYQDECKGNWAFAATGAIEGHYFTKKHILPNLSEQELIDCSDSFDNNGCNGGFYDYAFSYVVRHGIATSDNYPYTGVEQTCKNREEDSPNKYVIKGFRKIPPGDEKELQKVVAKLGPVACSMNAVPEDFLFFSNGIYNNPQCRGNTPEHSVLIVGYGESEKGEPYWIIKNSWGFTWGNVHYAGLPRNVNFCGIASDCSYPVLY